MKKEVTVNKEQELYVIPGGYSCLGFDVCLKRIDGLKAELKTVKPDVEFPDLDYVRGDLSAYEYYQTLLVMAAE